MSKKTLKFIWHLTWLLICGTATGLYIYGFMHSYPFHSYDWVFFSLNACITLVEAWKMKKISNQW